MSMSNTWKIIRWPLTLGAMAIVGFTSYNMLEGSIDSMYTFDISGSSILGGGENAAEEAGIKTNYPTGAVQSGTAKPISDFGVINGVVETGTSGVLLSDIPSSMIVAFDPIKGNPECFGSLGVTLTVMEATGTSVIGLFPSSVENPKAPRNGDSIKGDMQLSPNAMGLATLATPGTLTVDILPQYKAWFDAGKTAKDPLTFTITAAEAIDPGNNLKIATSEVGETRPQLVWTGLEGCK